MSKQKIQSTAASPFIEYQTTAVYPLYGLDMVLSILNRNVSGKDNFILARHHGHWWLFRYSLKDARDLGETLQQALDKLLELLQEYM